MHNYLDFSIPYFCPPLLLTSDSQVDLLSLKALPVQATLHSPICLLPTCTACFHPLSQGLGSDVPKPCHETEFSSAKPHQVSSPSLCTTRRFLEGGKLCVENWPGQLRMPLPTLCPVSSLAPAGISFTIPDGPAPDFLICFQDQLCLNFVVISVSPRGEGDGGTHF